MNTSIAPAAPTDSATNKSNPTMPDKSGWAGEIHTPEAEYNANVPVADIERDPTNRVPAPADVEARAASIAEVGLIAPVALLALGGGRHQLIAGETRWLAHKQLGRLTIAARIYKDRTAVQQAKMSLVENVQRTDLTPMERARKFKQLAEEGLKQAEIGKLAGGLSQPVVANALRLLELPLDVQAMIDGGKLTEAHGVSLVRFAKWPAVVSAMAKQVVGSSWSSKALNERVLPFAYELRKAGLVVDINTANTWSGDPVYTLPKGFNEKLGFFTEYNNAYYILPERPADDVWGPERARQDAARDAKAAVQAKREAAAVAKNGGMTAEQKALRAKKEKNKKQRAENAEALRIAIEKLKLTPAPTALLIAVVVKHVISGGYSAGRVSAAADLVGVKLPKGLASEQGGQGMRNSAVMRAMDCMDLLRVACAVLIVKETDDANKNAAGMPDNLEAMMNAELPKGVKLPAAGVDTLLEEVPAKQGKKKGGRVTITDEIRAHVKLAVEAGQTGAEISKMLGISLPSVQNIKKALGLKNGRASK